MLERLRAREIIRREQLAPRLAEKDLNLIELTGVLRQPEDAHVAVILRGEPLRSASRSDWCSGQRLRQLRAVCTQQSARRAISALEWLACARIRILARYTSQ